MNKITSYVLLLFLISIVAVASGYALEPIIFPAKGQSDEQMDQDKYACYTWANEQGAEYTQNRNHYNRAFAACMEGKGYTVK